MTPKESTDRKSMTEEDFLDAINSALDYGYGPHPTSSLFGSGEARPWFRADVTPSASESFEVPPKVVKWHLKEWSFLYH